jgi:hypothetical protein
MRSLLVRQSINDELVALWLSPRHLKLRRLEVLGRIAGDNFAIANVAGCDLQVVSSYEAYGQNFHSFWHIKHRLFNIGSKDCVIQSQTLNLETPTVIKAGETLDREQIFEHAPKLFDAVIAIGAAGSPRQTTT